MNIQKIKQKLYEQKRRVGLLRGAVNIQEYDECEHNLSAGISPDTWDIEISVKKEYNPIQDIRQKRYAHAKKISDGLETLILHVGGLHEPAHWELPVSSGKGCPYDIYNHDKILEAVKNSLPQDKKEQAGYVTNAFEDMIINPRCREFNGDFSGQVLFWDGEFLNAESKTGKKGGNPFYEAFVKLNMHLWGDKWDRVFLKRHYTNAPKIEKVVQKVIDEVRLPKYISDTSTLFNKSRWSQMASIFAKNMAKLLENQEPQERLSAYSNKNSGESSGQKKKSVAGNGVEKKLETKEGKEQISFGRYASGESQSPNITSYDNLDSLYTKLARNIPVKVEAMTKKQDLEISPLTYRAFDEEKDDITRIKPSKLVLSTGGDSLTFAYPDEPLTISSKSKVQRRSFPNFKLVVLDNSGSMKSAIDGSQGIGSTKFIPWGDKSKYHYALLGFYGIENFLQQQGVAQYIQHGLSVFSSGTRYSEGGFMDLEKVRKLALAPEFSGTKLELGVLKTALEGKESFVLSLSDGEVENWGGYLVEPEKDESGKMTKEGIRVKDDFKTLAEKNYFAHVQLGSESQFSQDLKSWGFPVFHVNSGEDLSRLMVDITKQTYNRFITE